MAKIEMWETEVTKVVMNINNLNGTERADLLYRLWTMKNCRSEILKIDILLCVSSPSITLILDNEDDCCNHERVKTFIEENNCELISIENITAYKPDDLELYDLDENMIVLEP